MFSVAADVVRKSFFPIFFRVQRGDSVRLGVSGTGFFVRENGVFVTANHVISDVPRGSELFYLGNVPEDYSKEPISIEELYRDIEKDVFVGKVAEKPLPNLDLMENRPEPCTSVCLCGYPMARIGQNSSGKVTVDNVRKYWQPTFVVDGLQGDHDGRVIMGFYVQHTSLRGMSGGPVFDVNGKVLGMDVATWTRKIPERDGGPTIVKNGIIMGAGQILGVLEEVNP